MSWTLLLADAEGSPLEESFATLDDELAEYLAGLDGFPTLQVLRELPRDEDFPFSDEARADLEREIAELAARAKRRELPAPPEWVGLEGTDDIRLGEALGWQGLVDFAQRIEHLLFLAKRMGLDLWAAAED